MVMAINQNKKGRAPIPIERCHLYGFRSPHALAIRLGVSLAKLEKLANSGRYAVFTLESGRVVQEPERALQVLHRKIHRYLVRVETPPYLHSTVKGRSYITNARAHVGNAKMAKVDVKSFFPSVPQWRVMHFFRERLNCAPDVAGLLANLLCYDGRLATGSAASPIISYYSFQEMFDEMAAHAHARNQTLTVYVDDVTLSGANVDWTDLLALHKIIKKHGLSGHKSKIAIDGRLKIVTGVAVTAHGVVLPSSRWKKIRRTMLTYDRARTLDQRERVLNGLVSMLYEATQIEPRFRGLAERYHTKLRRVRSRLAAAA